MQLSPAFAGKEFLKKCLQYDFNSMLQILMADFEEFFYISWNLSVSMSQVSHEMPPRKKLCSQIQLNTFLMIEIFAKINYLCLLFFREIIPCAAFLKHHNEYKLQ